MAQCPFFPTSPSDSHLKQTAGAMPAAERGNIVKNAPLSGRNEIRLQRPPPGRCNVLPPAAKPEALGP